MQTTDELIGQTLGDYRIESLAGRGGMGVVYRATQISLSRPVALKVLAPHLAGNPAYIERFRREATAAAALSHQNIVHVYAAGSTCDLHYFVMEYIEGETLHDRLAREGPLPPDEALATCVYLAQALDYAWKKAQIIHRDLKPGNVFVSTDGEVKLGDLGLAKSVGDDGTSMTQSGQTMGTAYYMSPEQARGEHTLDFRSDIYSLGCTLYQMLCGRFPYEGTFGAVIAKQITEPPPAILKVLPTCPMPVVMLLGKMLKKHPNERHQSYEELIEDLRRAHEKITQPRSRRREEAVEQATQRQQPPHVGSYIKKPAVLYAAMTTATIIVLAGVLVWAPWKPEREASSIAQSGASVPLAQSREPNPPPSQDVSPGSAGVPPAEVRKEELKRDAETPKPSVAEIGSAKLAGKEKVESAIEPPKPSVPDATPSSPAGETPALPVKPAVQLAQAAPQPAPSPAPAPASPQPSTVNPQPSAPQPADESFLKSISAMPPEQQVQAVIAKLKELNPQFNGKETHKIEGGAVTTLSFSTVGVTDISPVKALRWLRTLSIAPPALNQKGSLENLAPLQGMQLTWLWCHNNPITDLSPLKGMPLTVLSISGTQVSDLSPLTGMKLQVLSFNDTVVSDIAPLEGMPLTVLWCNNTKVADLTPLKAMPLREIKCDFVAERDAAVLRGIRTLAKINDLPAAVFWARVGSVVAAATPAGNVGGTSASRPVTVTPAQSRGTEASPTLARGPEKTMITSTGIEMVWIPPGTFLMGSTAKEREWALGPEGKLNPKNLFESGEPRQTIIKNGFWLGRTEVTVGQWQKFVNESRYVTDAEKQGSVRTTDSKIGQMTTVEGGDWRNPGFGFPLEDNHPACCITWNDAVAFCKWLVETERKAAKLPAGMMYRLPSEAEWEYACKGGKEGTKFWWGDSWEKGKGRLNVPGWASDAQKYQYVSSVDAFGLRGRNGFGLADMLGNVAEWCLDSFDPSQAHPEPYMQEMPGHALRGGNFAGRPGYIRCAFRNTAKANYAYTGNGFRVCCGVEPAVAQ